MESKRPRGRPKKCGPAFPTEMLRVKTWARLIKKHAIPSEPDLLSPQQRLVIDSLPMPGEVSFSSTQYLQWWSGKSTPTRKTLSKFSEIGFNFSDVLDRNAVTNFVNRHFSALDALEFEKAERRGIGSKVYDNILLVLSRINQEWCPCFGRTGYLNEYSGVDSWQYNYSDDNSGKRFSSMGWDKPDLYPGPRLTNGCLAFYDPFNLSSLSEWLLAIAPQYIHLKAEKERHAVELATVILCLRFIHEGLKANLAEYRSSGVGILVLELSDLFFSDEYSNNDASDALVSIGFHWPYEAEKCDVMLESLLLIRASYLNWLETNGISLKEVRSFL